jgi:ABC-type sugar transport system substrate-binding protein
VSLWFFYKLPNIEFWPWTRYAIRTAAQKAGTALVLFIDELQYVQEEQLAATAFTVPLFDEFMHRIMPGDDWWR